MRCKTLAGLLKYPDTDLLSALSECLRTAEAQTAAALEPFLIAVSSLPPGRLEEIYTGTFDLEPDSCLYVGHHLFGEDWRRGMFMARLKRRYGETGFCAGAEVPDHLAVVLGFLAQLPPGPEAEELLRDCVIPAIARVLRAVERKESPYLPVLRALLLELAPENDYTARIEELQCKPFSSSHFPILP